MRNLPSNDHFFVDDAMISVWISPVLLGGAFGGCWGAGTSTADFLLGGGVWSEEVSHHKVLSLPGLSCLCSLTALAVAALHCRVLCLRTSELDRNREPKQHSLPLGCGFWVFVSARRK